MDVDGVLPPIEGPDDEPISAVNVFIPGTHVLGKDEILEPDDSVYIMRHTMNVNWPCLSFDVLRDEACHAWPPIIAADELDGSVFTRMSRCESVVTGFHDIFP